MSTAVRAVYEDGVLKPNEQLPLDERTEVWLVVLPVETPSAGKPDAERLEAMRREVTDWLAQQPANAVREPAVVPPPVEKDFERALAAIRRRARRYSLEQIQSDVEAAVAEARTLAERERQQLDAELTQLLAQWVIDGVS